LIAWTLGHFGGLLIWKLGERVSRIFPSAEIHATLFVQIDWDFPLLLVRAV
jgi:hypothetical protein